MKIKTGETTPSVETASEAQAEAEEDTRAIPPAESSADSIEETRRSNEELLPPNPSALREPLNPRRDKTQPLTQADLNTLLKEVKNLQKPVIFKNLLKARGYSARIHRLDFAQSRLAGLRASGIGQTPVMGTDLYHEVDFSGMVFTNCTFDELNLKGAHLHQTRFENCSLHKTILYKANLDDVTFFKCDLSRSFLNQGVFKDTRFDDCNLKSASVCEATLRKTHFIKSNLESSNFWKTTAQQSALTECNLRNALLFLASAGLEQIRSAPNTLESPVVVTLWHPEFPGMSGSKVVDRLEERGAVVFKLDLTPQDIEPGHLASDIERGLDVLGPGSSVDTEKSRAQRLLSLVEEAPDTYPTLARLINETEALMPHLNGVVLPGGADVEREFYGDPVHREPGAPVDFRRTIQELVLLNQARRGVPLLGLCRGAQLANVFYGGTLKNVRGQFGKVQSYTVDQPEDEAEGFLRGLTGTGLLGASAHNQAIDAVGQKLDVVVRYDGIPKAVETSVGVPMMATQFHPEFHGDKSTLVARGLSFILSNTNAKIWDGFCQSMETHRQKQEVLASIREQPEE